MVAVMELLQSCGFQSQTQKLKQLLCPLRADQSQLQYDELVNISFSSHPHKSHDRNLHFYSEESLDK